MACRRSAVRSRLAPPNKTNSYVTLFRAQTTLFDFCSQFAPLESRLASMTKTFLKGFEEIGVLSPGHLGNAAPQEARLNNIMDLSPHLLLKAPASSGFS